jgi:hypothetical protein
MLVANFCKLCFEKYYRSMFSALFYTCWLSLSKPKQIVNIYTCIEASLEIFLVFLKYNFFYYHELNISTGPYENSGF